MKMFTLILESKKGLSGEEVLVDYLTTCYDYGEEVPNNAETIASFIRENAGKDDGFVYALILMDEHEDGSLNNVIEYFVTDSTNTIKYWNIGE